MLNLEFQQSELPEPPRPRGLGWLRAVGPGVIALGVSIGSGEFLLGPAAFVQHGFSLLWVVLIAITFQTIFNTEVMRYTLATGEPVFSGFMLSAVSCTIFSERVRAACTSGWSVFTSRGSHVSMFPRIFVAPSTTCPPCFA